MEIVSFAINLEHIGDITDKSTVSRAGNSPAASSTG